MALICRPQKYRIYFFYLLHVERIRTLSIVYYKHFYCGTSSYTRESPVIILKIRGGSKKVLILSNALNSSNNRQCCLRAYLFLIYSLILVLLLSQTSWFLIILYLLIFLISRKIRYICRLTEIRFTMINAEFDTKKSII